MEAQPEIQTPIGKWYYICQTCGDAFISESDVDYYDEDQTCEDCIDLLEDNYYEDRDDDVHFADPGGESALRAETPDNPRNLPCPNCGAEDVLTPEDVALHYCCDACAQRREMDF